MSNWYLLYSIWFVVWVEVILCLNCRVVVVSRALRNFGASRVLCVVGLRGELTYRVWRWVGFLVHGEKK